MTRRSDPGTARLPSPAGELPPFTPIPRQYERHDGWTPDRQRAFIEALADTGSVAAACKAVDVSGRGAYHLRVRMHTASGYEFGNRLTGQPHLFFGSEQQNIR